MSRSATPSSPAPPDRWELDEDAGRVTLVEWRFDGENDIDRRLYLGPSDESPEDRLPDYYPAGHPVYAAIERIRDDYAGRIFGDEYRREHSRTYVLAQGGK